MSGSPSFKTPADYIAYINSLIESATCIVEREIVREEKEEGEPGLYRYRLRLDNGDLLELVERFTVEAGQLKILKYRFHWQDAKGALRKRWDNAPHHSHLSTAPHHLHDGAEENVLPHPPMSAAELLPMVIAGQ
jgi:hypothetical protein